MEKEKQIINLGHKETDDVISSACQNEFPKAK